MNLADVLVHPVRMRIVQALGSEALSTQAIAERLADVPQSSLYRHLKVLLDAGFVAVAATRSVNGIEEKVYQVARSPFLSADDVAQMTADDHLNTLATFLLLVQQGFANYLAHADDRPDLLADRVGYTEVQFHASDAEFDALVAALNQALLPLLSLAPDAGRRRRKLVTITHPVDP